MELAILGLLKEKPMHGYELKKRLSFMLGHFWTVSYGSLYPALKRLEKTDAIEKAYSVKEKNRNRNVFRITPKGELEFMKLLGDTTAEKSIADTDKFDIRMAFFQYLDPETRLSLLEKRRRLLEEQIDEFRAYRRKNKDQDHYQRGLLKHKVEQSKNDIKWLDRLITQEKETVEKVHRKSEKHRIKVQREDEHVSAASSA